MFSSPFPFMFAECTWDAYMQMVFNPMPISIVKLLDANAKTLEISGFISITLLNAHSICFAHFTIQTLSLMASIKCVSHKLCIWCKAYDAFHTALYIFLFFFFFFCLILLHYLHVLIRWKSVEALMLVPSWRLSIFSFRICLRSTFLWAVRCNQTFYYFWCSSITCQWKHRITNTTHISN